jgi:FtsH-binding integral membrane protein
MVPSSLTLYLDFINLFVLLLRWPAVFSLLHLRAPSS